MHKPHSIVGILHTCSFPQRSLSPPWRTEFSLTRTKLGKAWKTERRRGAVGLDNQVPSCAGERALPQGGLGALTKVVGQLLPGWTSDMKSWQEQPSMEQLIVQPFRNVPGHFCSLLLDPQARNMAQLTNDPTLLASCLS